MGPSAVAPLTRAGFGRLAAVGAVVFLANAGLLVLQLVAGRLLAPFVGSSLETWTAIIGAFLTGIALGNALGGRLADRHPSGRRLAVYLVLGAAGAVWMIALPWLLNATSAHRSLPLAARIPVLAAVLCFPPGFVLSLLTPLAIKLGLPDVRHAGRVAGLVFALGTLGCLVGNYLTGFYLLATLTVNAIVLLTAGLLVATAGLAYGLLREVASPAPATAEEVAAPTRGAVLPLRIAYLIVFLCSFAGMTLELAGVRLLAQVLGVSLFTWTGVIGVMLAGTAFGNWLGGMLGDRAARSADPTAGSHRLGLSLVLAAGAAVLVLMLYGSTNFELVRSNQRIVDLLYRSGAMTQVVTWSFLLFFLPMALLGTISPQVIRLAVPDAAHAGRVAGRVYAWSTAGAIAGTFATGFFVISTIGLFRTLLVVALLPGLAALAPVIVPRVWRRPGQPADASPAIPSLYLYGLSIVFGLIAGGFYLVGKTNTEITKETNYYTIRVVPTGSDPDDPVGVLKLLLDYLIHSWVKPDDPTYLYYHHEHIQMELLRAAAAAHPEEQRVLVIGGGGYTYPRCARTKIKSAKVEVVEIDPGVTEIAYSHLWLDRDLGIITHNMDGRQFVAERAGDRHYHLVTLDAVNDLSVPYHLLTREFNQAVERVLTPDGVYLLTVIDMLEDGQLWKAAIHTLRETFPHVEVLTPHAYDPVAQQVYVIYAAQQPLDLEKLYATLAAQGVTEPFTKRLPPGEFERLLAKEKPIVLTDQFAPVDQLMAEVFRRRRQPIRPVE
jgi:spermidine synthase/MFS family permease